MDAQRVEVVVVDVKMPFWSMVALMVKWTVAAIPAILFLVVWCAIIIASLNSIFADR